MSTENLLAAPPIEKETRFAVVMYGGVSLAIYIHGVAQELYHMVRATARTVENQSEYVHPWEKLKGTEKIYRRLGETLKTKFVVDILSGTSAGGLNAVFLAKAIANQQSSMEFVKGFWIREGDISTLLNDRGSLLSGLSLREPTPGLMNSQRFYYKILEALMKMESHERDFRSPYVEELDLNITATDIRGLNLPLYINAGNAIQEARYKNVFQFYYRPKRDTDSETQKDGPRNDFTRKMDPFLAFAARCTASIPPAFEAMQLKDIEPILGTAGFRKDYGSLTVNDEDWKRIYKEYVNEGDDFPLRSFGDGGYLDNKPFSYATESILRRRADLPVDRRLIYIEPSPEHPEDKPLPSERPDMLENLLAALINLPRSETIREDLEKIAERNRVVRKVKHVLSESFYHNPAKGEPDWVHTLEWPKKYLMDSDVLAWYGNGYITYHQLRVESVLKDLSVAFSQILGWNESGPEEERLHSLLHSWLNKMYSARSHENISEDDIPWLEKFLPAYSREKMSQNDILFRLDLGFRMRKHHFLQHILNTILRNLGDYLKAAAGNTDPAGKRSSELKEITNIFEQSGQALTQGSLGEFADKNKDDSDEDIENCLVLLRGLKSEMNDIYTYIRARDRYMRKGLPVGVVDAGFDAYLSKLNEVKDKLGGGSDDLVPLIEELSVTLGTHLREKEETSYSAGASVTHSSERPSGYLYVTFKEISNRDLDLGIRKREEDFVVESFVAEDASKEIKHKEEKGAVKLATEGVLEELLKTKYPSVWAGFEKIREEKKLKSITDVPGFKFCLAVYQHVQRTLAFYYDNFEYYDMLTFPIQYGTDAGESDEVEIIRVSPEDATLLIDERGGNKKKLAGTSLANFGAFFKKEWRENDIMWGRLDAAEILIRQLTGWKPDVNDMDEDERKKWNDFMVRLKELHQEEFPMADTDFARTEDFPFNLAFQIILEEDLRPRDDFIFYSFIDGKFETEDKTGDEAAAPKPETKTPPELQKLLAREESLNKLESALQKTLRENIGSAPDRLKKEIIDPVAKEKESVKRKKEEQENSLRENQKDLSSSVKSSAGGLKSLPDAISGKMKAGLKKLRKNNNLRYKEVMRSLREDPHEILKYFRSGYEVDKKFPPETLNTASRAIGVLEKLLLGLSEKHPFLSGIKGPISTTSRLGTGLLLAARGGSYTTVVAIAFYISSLLVILAGWLIPSFKDSMPIGVLAFLLTFVAHASALQIRSAFLGKIHLPSKIAIEILSVLVGLIPFFLIVTVALLIYLGLLGLGWLDIPAGPLGEWIKHLIAACPTTATPDMPLFCRPAE